MQPPEEATGLSAEERDVFKQKGWQKPDNGDIGETAHDLQGWRDVVLKGGR